MFPFRSLICRRSAALVINQRMNFADKTANKIRKEPGEKVDPRVHRVLTTRLHRTLYWRGRSHESLTLPEMPRSHMIEWDLRSELYAFGKRLGENLSEESLRIAFTDPSYVEVQNKKREELGTKDAEVMTESNKKLAQLGHDTMSNFIPKYLRYFLPRVPEDGILAIRSYLLDDAQLADMSKWLGTYDIILCEFPSEPELAQTLRAVVGAVTKESGEKGAEKFIIDFILTYLQDKQLFEIWDIPDARKAVSRILANEAYPDYESRLLRSTAMHTIESCFQVGLFVNKQLFGSGTGETVEIAEEMAAYDCLARMFQIRPNDYLFKFGPKSYELDYEAHSRSHQPLNLWSSQTLKPSNVHQLDG